MRNVIHYILNPPHWLKIATFCMTLVLAVLSLTCVFLNLGTAIYAYIVYAVAAIFLTYSVYIFVRIAPNIKSAYVACMNKFSFTQKLYSHYGFRTATLAGGSLALNLAFAIFEITISIMSSSIWWAALGAYHLVLGGTRTGILVRNIKDAKTPLAPDIKLVDSVKTYRRTGICVLILHCLLIGAMVQMMLSQNAFTYAGLMIYAMATYAFWKLGMAIWGMFRFKKHNSFTTQSFRSLNLTDALVTLFALQTALIAAFGTPRDTAMQIMNLISGVVVSVLTISIGSYMIIKSNKKLNQIKNN